MLQTPVLKQLGLSSVPDNIVFQRGRIVARSLDAKKLEERVGKMINENWELAIEFTNERMNEESCSILNSQLSTGRRAIVSFI